MPRPQIKFPKGPAGETLPAKRRRVAVYIANLLEADKFLLEAVDALMSASNPTESVDTEYEVYDCD